ncbi:MAG TPA: hypothetical protein VF532_20575, partial [Candidatus Angelobacter sp.]
SHMNLAFLAYLAGDKAVALDEFGKARAIRPSGFDKAWKDEIDFDPFKPVAADKEFVQKLFPNGAPQ